MGEHKNDSFALASMCTNSPSTSTIESSLDRICWHVQLIEFNTKTFLKPPRGKGDSYQLPILGAAPHLLDQVISELAVRLPWAVRDEL